MNCENFVLWKIRFCVARNLAVSVFTVNETRWNRKWLQNQIGSASQNKATNFLRFRSKFRLAKIASEDPVSESQKLQSEVKIDLKASSSILRLGFPLTSSVTWLMFSSNIVSHTLPDDVLLWSLKVSPLIIWTHDKNCTAAKGDV